jgi:sugar/nucleoside kinase (ribokinase family)
LVFSGKRWGARDAFTAAMVNRLLRRRPLDEVAAFANQVGAYVASQPGATPPPRRAIGSDFQ